LSGGLTRITAALLFKRYNYSVFNTARAAFPQLNWIPWKFEAEDQSVAWWTQLALRLQQQDRAAINTAREYLEHLQQIAGIDGPQKWHDKAARDRLSKTDQKRVNSLGGFPQLLYLVYPEEPLCIWKFGRSPPGWWGMLASKFAEGDAKAVATMRTYVAELSAQHQVKSLEDWYSVARKLGKGATYYHFSHFGSIGSVLRALYPKHPWDFPKSQSSAT